MPDASTILVAHPSADLYGSDRVLLESVSALAGAGWTVVVTVPVDGPLVDELVSRGARVHRCPAPVLRKSALRPRGALQLARDLLTGARQGKALLRDVRPDLVYVNTLTIPLWLALARLHHVPALSHVHEAEASAPWVLRFALAAPQVLATTIVTNSAFSTGVLTGVVPRLADRCVVVLNAVPGPPVVQPPRPELTPPVRLLYLGRVSERKGVQVAVEALRLLRRRGTSAELRVVGAVFPGYEWFLDRLRRQLDEGGLQTAVRFTGFVPQVWDALAAADVVLVPSTVDEPFGNTAVESVLAARPVVVSDTSGLREAAAGYACVAWAPPGDAGALADAVQHVVECWETMHAAALADAVVAADRHAVTRYGERLLAAVEQARSGRSRRR